MDHQAREAAPGSATRRVLTGAGAVTAGSMLANIAAYLLHLPASRWLGPEGYGAFAALLSAQLLVAVPSLALQAVVAREHVRGVPRDVLRALGRRAALLVAVVAASVVVPMSLLLDTPVWATAAALAPGPVLCLLATEQGLLQGAERFRALGVVLALAGAGKVAPAVAVLAVGGGVGPALAAGAVGVGAAWFVAARVTYGPATAPSRVGTLGGSVGAPPRGSGVEPRGDGAALTSPGVAAVLAAGQVQLVMMALTSVDLLLARALLAPEDAGRYALGAVAAKAAFWLPQAVGTVLYPRMADPAGHRGAVRSAVTVLLGIGAVVVIGAAVAAPLVPVVVGEDYRPVAGLLWAFALLGVTLSVLQAFLLAIIASDRTVEAGIAWCGLVLTAIAVWSAPRDVEGVLAAALVAVVLTTVTAGWRALRSRPA
ncbi:polysaccharide biosynthesis protein [Dietzia cinnamea]|uniref:polysaccharide biosynthesis protein n=1 Tax=Dietzia cinnamea TaxID=321318 RepID=UPI000D61625F|nr:polysaccharide biosynthesis protein [Dietzia cinnamea]MBM7230612.1 polysaccharide biosynthesis protein [Dietzia cinnamea]MCT2263381.1 polysaccharide biosynthesis protein [Dietzia cinnamea]PWD95483.1 polysaccharide biosynthesis protein [Dietzia maris]